MKFSEKSVLAVTILLRKVARCILGTRNWVLTLLRRQREKIFFRPAVGGWSFCYEQQTFSWILAKQFWILD
jgi:hypothetical protein